MNNKIAIAVVAIIVIAGGAFLLTRNKAKSPSTVDSNTEATADAESEASIESGSIESLIAAGRSQMCTFSSKEQDTQTSGTMYVSGGKMRGDFETDTGSGNKTVSHMMYDGTTSYVWSDGSNMGFKMALDTSDQTSAPTQGVDPKKNYEYHCEKWSTDNSKFELPSNVEFTSAPSVTTGRQDDASSSIDNKEMQKAICNNLPEPGKTQCLAGLQ